VSWKEYQSKIGVKHNFAKFGCKEFWVKLRRLDSFSYGEAKDNRGVSSDEVEELLKDPKRADEARDEVEEQLIGCIMDWHITDPTIQNDKAVSDEEKARSMPVPTEGDPTSLNKLPAEFIVFMFECLRDDSELAKSVPK